MVDAEYVHMDERSREIERRMQLPLMVAALLTIPAIVIEYSSTSHGWTVIATTLNWVIWLAFLAEIVIMLRVVPDRRRWLRDHPLELAIVILSPPFLPPALQAARMFRLLRLLRLAKLGVLTRRVLSTEGVRDVAVLAAMTVLAGGAAFAAVESTPEHPLSAWDGIWWAITTVTTVGYGDPAVTTDAGRVIGIVVMLVGIGFVAILTASAAERFMRAQRAERHELEVVEQRLAEIIQRLEIIEREASR